MTSTPIDRTTPAAPSAAPEREIRWRAVAAGVAAAAIVTIILMLPWLFAGAPL